MNTVSIEPYSLHLASEHIHSVAKVYPTLAAGVTVTTAAGAWTLGNYAQIVPASTIASRFDIHWINVEAASNDDTYELVLYAATTEIGRVRFTVSLTAGGRVLLPPMFFQCPIVAANSQIQAKLACSAGGAETVDISIHYHTY